MKKREGLVQEIIDAAGETVEAGKYVYKLRDDGWILRCEKDKADMTWISSSGVMFDAWQTWMKTEAKTVNKHEFKKDVLWRDGDILSKANESGPDVIVCCQVNCKGKINPGTAGKIRERYPAVYTEYFEHCRAKRFSSGLMGDVLYSNIDGKTQVASLFNQYKWSREPGGTDFDVMKVTFRELFKNNEGKVIRIPYGIGCSKNESDWDTVLEIIRKEYQANGKNVVEIWKPAA